MIGGRIEILGSAAVALDGTKVGVTRVGRSAAQAQQLAEHLLHIRRIRGFHAQAQIGFVGIGAADAEFFYFKFAVVFDYCVEDSLHQVRIDQVAFGLDDFLLHGYLSGYRDPADACKCSDKTNLT